MPHTFRSAGGGRSPAPASPNARPGRPSRLVPAGALLGALLGLLAGCAAPGPEAPEAEGTVAAGEGAVASADSYRLGQGDRIAIQVFDEPDLTMETQVGASGVINYSYLGNLQVADKNTVEIEQEITRLLRDGYLVNPSVNVSVLEYRPFFVNGEVRNPGSYSYQPGLTLGKAIALAGGLTDRASGRKMYVSNVKSRDEQARVGMSYRVAPGDVITINEGFF